MNKLLAYLLVAMCCLALSLAGRAAEADGWFGFTVNADVDGFFSPVLRSITVISVSPDSPAASRGLAAGDKIAGVEGIAVAGHAAKEIQVALHKAIGETLQLRLTRANGESYLATLTAAAKPTPH